LLIAAKAHSAPGLTSSVPSPVTIQSSPGSVSVIVYVPGIRLFQFSVPPASLIVWQSPLGYDGPVMQISNEIAKGVAPFQLTVLVTSRHPGS